ncbi:MAG: RecT family recombinase [Clostridium perfringens]|nr:RecT family recombinase [Clostridium butyricum]MDU5776263.1 RecT family recombinase [Clostridium perfringens]
MENKQVSVQEKNVTDKVLSRIKALEGTGDITMPANYSYSNALKSAYLILSETVDRDKKPVLQSCSQTSIINTLLDMTIQGLSPAKKQCYFIAFGGKLQLMKSYLGNIAATKRLKGVKNVFANVIYEKDEFSYELDLETGLKKITKHNQDFENIDINKIKGAYAVIVMEDGLNYVEVMNINQIRNSWSQGAAKGQSGAHKNFTDEMAKKTVINRACKNFVCTSDDSDLLIESMNRTNEYNPEDIVESTHEEVKEEIKQNANQEVIDISVEEVKAEEVGPNPNNRMTKQMEMGDEPF